MLNIELPDDLAGPLAAEAERRGTTPELLALEGVRRMLPPPEPRLGPGTMLDMLGDFVGAVNSKTGYCRPSEPSAPTRDHESNDRGMQP